MHLEAVVAGLPDMLLLGRDMMLLSRCAYSARPWAPLA